MVLTTRSVTCGSPRPPPRAGARLSISSMNNTQGATCRARANRRAICCSLSPYHFDNKSEDLTAIKFAAASRATAFASKVFPVPGGPYSRNPLAGRMPNRRNASGLRSGSSTPSFKRIWASSSPPTSSQRTSGACTMTSRMADGCTRFSASKKSSRVTFNDSRISGGILPLARSILGMIRRTASIAASRASAPKSAPTKPYVVRASSFRSTRGPKGMPRVWIARISRRPFSSGTPTTISRSNRPGRLSASSIASGRLVAAITTRFVRGSSPSIRVSNCATNRFSASPCT